MTAATLEATTDAVLLARFAPVLERIAAGAARRERARELPLAEVRELAEAGLGAVRVPRELGGLGASIPQLYSLLREIAAADSNIPQALRQHFFQVELLLRDPEGNRAWIERVVAGDLFGNATTEPPGGAIGEIRTILRPDPAGDGFRLSGRKVYGTGNAFAQWIPVGAVTPEGAPAVPVVPVDRAGVTIHDDWNGFGQRLTATSSVEFDDVRVEPHEVRSFPTGGPRRGGSGLHQTVLLATLAGIAEGAARELAGIVRAKTRVYYTGTGELPRHDAVVQEQVGRARAVADATRWILDGVTREMEAAWRLWDDPEASNEEVDAAFLQVELSVASAQVIVSEQVLDATSHLLDVLGASSLDADLALDRYWRNARAIASHNPYPFKARLLGDWELNDTPPALFQVGRDVGDKR